MSTIGHPLADLTNLMTPFTRSGNAKAREYESLTGRGADSAFAPGATPGLPTEQQCLQWYAATAGWEFPAREYAWGEAFNVFKGAIIAQGIAARAAVRQASSANAHLYAAMMGPFGEVAWDLVERAMREVERARL